MSDLLCIEICFLSLLPSVFILLPYLSVHLSVYESVCLSVCLSSLLLHFFQCLFLLCRSVYFLSIFLSIVLLLPYLAVCLSLCLFNFFTSFYWFILCLSFLCPSFFPPFYHSVSLFLCLSVCLFVISSTNEIVWNKLFFTHTLREMSNVMRWVFLLGN